MCTEFIQLVDSSLPKYPIATSPPSSTLLSNSDQQHLLQYISSPSPPVCRCSMKNAHTNSKKSTDSKRTLLDADTDDKEKTDPITMTPATTPKPIFTHKLPDNFFSSCSPPVPISPISNLASRANSPISSPHIHPIVTKLCPLVDPIDKCIEHLSIQDSNTASTSHLPNSSEIPVDRHHYNESHKHHRLSLDDFIIKQTVGTGSSARVHLAKSKVNGKYYAIKAISKSDLVNKRQVEHANNERYVLGSVSHPFLVKLWGSFQSESHVFLVMDYVPGGELFRQLRKQKAFTEDEARFYAAEVVLALEYLHSVNIAYRDLKPENILIDRQGHIKITDFGFAKRVVDRTWTVCGTPDYLAPEIIRSQGYTKAVDWWSLGVLIYEMITGSPPFTAKNPIDQYQKILECDITFPSSMSPEVVDLLQNLLKTKASERFGNLKNGANDIKQHAWFKGIDFEQVLARQLPPPFVPDIKFEGDTGCFAYYEEMQLPYHMIHTSEPYCSHFPYF
ncbi:cAMP-dependent protein kinase type 2-like [Mucor ambiguus]|uniref:cAMP-dependent protein kinase n=1 Tax=Mucor ambiguus TaxID=91626 RepID=A0A0C9MQU9_9FUNG|nr:cAMP-dependent protein kinase type 2-like [Mucor ambiguus]